MIFFFIRITCQLDVVLILRRDILSWLLLGVKELNKINQLCSRKKTMILAKFTQVYQWVGPDEVEVTKNFQAINNCLFLDFGMLSLVLVSTVTVVCPSAWLQINWVTYSLVMNFIEQWRWWGGWWWWWWWRWWWCPGHYWGNKYISSTIWVRMYSYFLVPNVMVKNIKFEIHRTCASAE